MTREPIDTLCRTTFRAAHDSGERDPRVIRWVVLHDEEALTAESAARWFANPDSAGSAHLCVDDLTCYRTLPNDVIAWGAPPNTFGFHIEQAGFAKWSAAVWRSHLWTLRRAAYKCALHCGAFDLPPRFVAAPGLKAGVHGVTTHRQMSLAFGGDHSDPGPLWPRRLFMRLVRSYYAELGL